MQIKFPFFRLMNIPSKKTLGKDVQVAGGKKYPISYRVYSAEIGEGFMLDIQSVDTWFYLFLARTTTLSIFDALMVRAAVQGLITH